MATCTHSDRTIPPPRTGVARELASIGHRWGKRRSPQRGPRAPGRSPAPKIHRPVCRARSVSGVEYLPLLPPLPDHEVTRTVNRSLPANCAGAVGQMPSAIAQLAQLEIADARPPEFSDEALALRFAEKHADDLRYVAAWGKWFVWTGMYWRRDDTLLAFDLVRAACRAAAARAESAKTKRDLASAQTVAAVERLAKAHRRLAATVDQWDADPWLLNTPGGTVELRTGKLRLQRSDDYITKITAVTPRRGRRRRWLKFLKRIMDGDRELIQYLQRVAGYALTGITREHALFFAGTGANGKGVFLSTLTNIMADFATTTPIETLIASNTDRHPTDLAGLRGARLVTAQEIEQGRRWAESRIKAITGGDKISARFMRQDFFEYAPQFKLLIAGNHKPGLRRVDEAIPRRMNLIPFKVTIPNDERDNDLAEKLKAEWSEILELDDERLPQMAKGRALTTRGPSSRN